MNGPEHTEPTIAALAERLQNMEELYMHLQRLVQELDQVIIGQSRQLATLEQQHRAAQVMLRTLSSASSSPTVDLIDEKPPHY